MNVRDEYQAIKVKAAMLAKQADGRDWTPEEMAQAVELKRQGDELEPKVKQFESDQQVKAYIAGLGHTIADAPEQPAKTAQTVGEVEPRSGWSVKNERRTPWVKNTMARVAKMQDATGAKSLVTGSLDVVAPVDTEIIRKAEYPTRVLDLLIDRKPISGTNTFGYTRETLTTNNAAPVAEGAEKPVSQFTVAPVEGRCRTVAHLSEPLPEQLLADHDELADYLEVSMERGLLQALEEQIISGDGTGENFEGLMSVSGLLVQPYTSNVYTTLRKARTTMAVVGEQPTAWLLNPADTEAIDLLREGTDGGFLLATPPGNILGNLPIVESTAIPAGTAMLADWSWWRLMVRQDTTLDIDRSADLFRTNRVQLRLEGRWGLAVRRTTAFCQIDLTAA